MAKGIHGQKAGGHGGEGRRSRTIDGISVALGSRELEGVRTSARLSPPSHEGRRRLSNMKGVAWGADAASRRASLEGFRGRGERFRWKESRRGLSQRTFLREQWCDSPQQATVASSDALEFILGVLVLFSDCSMRGKLRFDDHLPLNSLARSVTVAHEFLVLRVMVRIHAGQLSERLKRHSRSIPDARIAAPFNLCRFVNMRLRFARCPTVRALQVLNHTFESTPCLPPPTPTLIALRRVLLAR